MAEGYRFPVVCASKGTGRKRILLEQRNSKLLEKFRRRSSDSSLGTELPSGGAGIGGSQRGRNTGGASDIWTDSYDGNSPVRPENNDGLPEEKWTDGAERPDRSEDAGEEPLRVLL